MMRAAIAFSLVWSVAVLPLPSTNRVAPDERGRSRDVGRRVEGKASWDQLRLPDDQLAILREFAASCRSDSRERRKGMAIVFHGGGSGKTIAALLVAADLKLDVYQVDLAQVVSKYTGKTEENLRRIFDSAEENEVILLFDKADALFKEPVEARAGIARNPAEEYFLKRLRDYRGITIVGLECENAASRVPVKRVLRFRCR